MRRTLGTLVVLIIAAFQMPALAAGRVTVTRSGADLLLSWSGGTGPYDIVRAVSPLGANAVLLADDLGGHTYTVVGGASGGAQLYFYLASDVSAQPTLQIQLPCAACRRGRAGRGVFYLGLSSPAASMRFCRVLAAGVGEA